MKRVFIIHGYTDRPGKNWFPWLQRELEQLGAEVTVPAMPNTLAPWYHKWLNHLQQVVGEVDEDTYFVGHSLGCPTILRFLENLPEGKKAGGAVLVAGFAESIHLTQLNSFTSDQWNDDKIKRSVGEIVLINSDNDQHVPLAIGERMRDRFDAKLVVLHDAGHINEKAGYSEVPLVRDKLLELLKG